MKAGGRNCTCECSCQPSLGARPTYVYRAYSKAGALLYVGITYDLHQRMRSHSKDPVARRWYNAASEIRCALYPDRNTAHIVEQRAISEERPSHNGISDARLLKFAGPLPAPVSVTLRRGGL